MSGYPTKQIDGDVSVGRHVALGGTATVRGSVTVGHNLRVEGWLEAKNIKGTGKGLYKTVAALRAAYPLPHDGWWALVLVNSQSDHLGQLYLADGGVWVAQVDGSGNPLLKGNPTVDDTECKESIAELTGDLDAVKAQVSQHTTQIASLQNTQREQTGTLTALSGKVATVEQGLGTVQDGLSSLQGDLDAVTKHVSQHDTDIAGLRTAQSTQAGKVTTLEQSVSNLQSGQALQGTRIETLATGQQGLRKDLNTLTDSIGEADGIAPLDGNGKIASLYLPDGMDSVLEIGGIVSDVIVQQSSSGKQSTDADCSVVWNATTAALVLMVQSGSTFTYYANWQDGDRYGTAGAQGRTPLHGKLYIDTSTHQCYHWDDDTLQEVGAFALLGADGRISSEYLPSDMDDVLEMGGMVSGVAAQQSSSSMTSTTAGCSVVWDIVSQTLLLAVQDTLRPVATYYTNWQDGDRYGTAGAHGRVPLRGKLYIDTSTHKTYYWTGTAMQAIGADGGSSTADSPQPYTYSVDNLADIVPLTATGALKQPLVQTAGDGSRTWLLHSSIQVRRGQTVLMETTGSASTGKYSLTAVCDGCTAHFERSTLYIDTVDVSRGSASVQVTIDCEGKSALTFVFTIKMVRDGGTYTPQTVALHGRVTLTQGGDGGFHDYIDGDTAAVGTGAVALYSGATTVVLPETASDGDRYTFVGVDAAARLTIEGVAEGVSGIVMVVWYGGKWVLVR